MYNKKVYAENVSYDDLASHIARAMAKNGIFDFSNHDIKNSIIDYIGNNKAILERLHNRTLFITKNEPKSLSDVSTIRIKDIVGTITNMVMYPEYIHFEYTLHPDIVNIGSIRLCNNVGYAKIDSNNKYFKIVYCRFCLVKENKTTSIPEEDK